MHPSQMEAFAAPPMPFHLEELYRHVGELERAYDFLSDLNARTAVAKAIVAAVDAHKFKPDIDTLVLDGIPRNVEQAQIMDKLIEVKRVFHLSCPDRDTLFERLKKRALKDNRLDDANEDVIRKRLALYDTDSKPVLTFYPQDMVTSIDATQPPVRVMFEILAGLNGANGTHATV